MLTARALFDGTGAIRTRGSMVVLPLRVGLIFLVGCHQSLENNCAVSSLELLLLAGRRFQILGDYGIGMRYCARCVRAMPCQNTVVSTVSSTK